MVTAFTQFLRQFVGDDYATRRFVLGVSGGRDSMALLETGVLGLASANLVVAHFNHRLRGEASDTDESFVAGEAARRQIDFVSERGTGSASAEADLRRERWAFLQAARKMSGADFILVAHSADDQLETFLMRLLRGTGIDGLPAMTAKRGTILRPFLFHSRAEIARFAAERGVSLREDESNESPRYLRNCIRHQVLPPLKNFTEKFGGFEIFLQRFTETQRELAWARAVLRTKTRRRFAKICVETQYWIRVSDEDWTRLPSRWRGRVFREILRRFGTETPGRIEATAMLHRIAERRRRLTLMGGVEVEQSCGHLFFHSQKMRTALRQNRSFAETCGELGLEINPDTEGELRFFRPGDRYGSGKLKETLLKARIPAPERQLLPLLARVGSSEILWFFPSTSPSVIVSQITFPFSFLPQSDRCKSSPTVTNS